MSANENQFGVEMSETGQVSFWMPAGSDKVKIVLPREAAIDLAQWLIRTARPSGEEMLPILGVLEAFQVFHQLVTLQRESQT